MGICFRAGPTPLLRQLPRTRIAGTAAPRAENEAMPTSNGLYMRTPFSSGPRYELYHSRPFLRRPFFVLCPCSMCKVPTRSETALVVPGESLGVPVQPWNQTARQTDHSNRSRERRLAHEWACHGSEQPPPPCWRVPANVWDMVNEWRLCSISKYVCHRHH